MVTPAGLPAWTRTAGADTYGGVATLRNLGDIGAVNAKTDITAEEYLRIASDLARCVQTAPLFWMRFTCFLDPPMDAFDFTVQPMWAPAEFYSAKALPPSSMYPTIEIVNAGEDIAISFPGATSTIGGADWITFTDDYGVSGSFQMANVMATIDGAQHAVTISGDGTVATITGGGASGTVYLVAY